MNYDCDFFDIEESNGVKEIHYVGFSFSDMSDEFVAVDVIGMRTPLQAVLESYPVIIEWFDTCPHYKQNVSDPREGSEFTRYVGDCKKVYIKDISINTPVGSYYIVRDEEK